MPLSMNNYGEFDPSYNAIRIRSDIGQYSQVSRHELSHAYIYDMNLSALNTIICQVSGASGPDGVWYSSTPVMTASTVGDYDILVDIGNNGVLHFAYNGANVRDGFDGLDGSGFTVYDDGIDVVLALDLTQSMVGEGANLQLLSISLYQKQRQLDWLFTI